VGASAALPLSFAKKKGKCLPVKCIFKYSAELRRCLVPAMAVDVKVPHAAAPAPASAAVASVWKVSATDFGDDDELLADDDLLDEEDMRKPTADELQGVCAMPIGRAALPCEPFAAKGRCVSDWCPRFPPGMRRRGAFTVRVAAVCRASERGALSYLPLIT
jgi:hypothetical protein